MKNSRNVTCKIIKNWHLGVLFCCVSILMNAQVGINTTNPNAILDIRSSSETTPTNTDGVLIPKIDNFPTTQPTASQDGMLVFATGNGTPNKGFYYWDHSNTTWSVIANTTTTGGNTLDQAYDQGGAGLGKNINATNGAVRINGTDGFLVTGEVYYGNPIDNEVTGAGTRMFFNPVVSAFRAGTIWDIPPLVGDEWDTANIGLFSVGFGLNTVASGLSSTAFGVFTSATGNQSTAFGNSAIASGISSTAFGNATTASGNHAVAFGYDTEASDHHSTAFGTFTTASDTYATAFGHQSTASGNISTAFGSDTTASGDESTAFGSDSTASGNGSTAFGVNTEASGYNTTSFGNNSVASGYISSALGFYTVAPSSFETAIGIYNSNYTPVSTTGYIGQDRIFSVGNGTSNATRSNALTIYKNGLININDAYDLPTTDGSANQVLTTDGAGEVSFQNITTTLDSAYDGGIGFGAGRVIYADSGPVQIIGTGGLITASVNQTHMLYVNSFFDQVGVATNNPTATFSVNGVANKPGGGDWAVFSDKRLKENISDYTQGIDFIKQIRPVNFSYNAKSEKLFGENAEIKNTIFQGVIAQELQKIAPEMVREVTIDNESFLEVDPNKFTYALINSVKQQQTLIDSQKQTISELKSLLHQQQAEIEKIKELILNNKK